MHIYVYENDIYCIMHTHTFENDIYIEHIQRPFPFCIFLDWTTPTEKSLLNLAETNQIWIVITVFQLICVHQTEFDLVPNQSEKCNYNHDLVANESYDSVYNNLLNKTNSETLNL